MGFLLKKVGLFVGTPSIFEAEGGIGRYMRILDGHLTTKRKDNLFISRIELTPQPRFFVPSLTIWTMLLNTKAYDIIHILGPLPFFQLLYKKHNCTIITTAHDFMPTSLIADNIKNPISKIWHKSLADMRISLNSDYLIAISTLTRDEAAALGFDRKKIKVINYGLDERFFTKIDRKKQGKIFKIGYVGSFPVRKNVRFAMSAVKMMKDKDLTFTLYGRKDLEYESLLKQADGDKRIKFKGKVDESELPAIYDSFDVSVFPSLNEGFGLPMLEAQARGLPVVIYKGGQIPKEVRKMCFEAEDEAHMAQILQDLKDNGFNEKKRKAMIRYARSFTWAKNVKSTIDFYKKVA
jgi:glycosyltransferase involved in cell wall biosynthesis